MDLNAIPESVRRRAAAVRLVVFDVDGVLTDGKLYYSADGVESKAFHVQDGAALKLLQQQGIAVAIVTGRQSPMVARRARELGIDRLLQNAGNKADALATLLDAMPAADRPDLGACAAVGDDLQDLTLFNAVGFAVSVPNGHPSAQRSAHWVTATAGGEGVARELAELILRCQDRWTFP